MMTANNNGAFSGNMPVFVRPTSTISLNDFSAEPSHACQDHPSSINIEAQSRTKVLPPASDSDGETVTRLVVLRYFLDRPGYGLHNSAARLWFDPPSLVTPSDVHAFLSHHEIAQSHLLLEVYLDQYQSFMLLEACEHARIVWDFTNTSCEQPGILNIRLTNLSPSHDDDDDDEGQTKSIRNSSMAASLVPQTASTSSQANTTPIGLFSFSIMVGLETTVLMSSMFGDDVVSPLFLLSWGPFMIFVGGLLQFIVAILQVFRNNIYGATAFFGFGSFWFANGTTLVLQLYAATPETSAQEILDTYTSDPVGVFLRTFFVFLFTVALWIQTFHMNRLSTTLIFLLGCKVVFAGLAGFSQLTQSMQYGQLITGWMTSLFAFYVFLVELTNNVYNREVFCTYKWSTLHSPEEVFGAAGKMGTLQSEATRLRQARYSSQPELRAVGSDRAKKTQKVE